MMEELAGWIGAVELIDVKRTDVPGDRVCRPS